jgi:FkbM family methyltransferase
MNALQPRPLEKLLVDLGKSGSIKTFIQIGANDGQYADPINLAIQLGLIKGLLVEPNPQYFTALKSTYKNIPGLEFLNAGVGEQAGQLTLYTFDKEDKSIPAWLLGSSSFSKAAILHACRKVPGSIDKLIELNVPIVPVSEILNTSAFSTPDLLVIDAEGFDAVILNQFLDASVFPQVILYEKESMKPEDKIATELKLKSSNYEIKDFHQDNLAIRRKPEPSQI